MPAITTLTASLGAEIKWTAQNTITGSDYQPLTNAGSIRKTQNLGTSVANAGSGGADQFVSYVISLAGAATVTIDIQTLTNILQQTAGNFTRLKGWAFRLLSVADDAAIGTAASSITVGNSGVNSQLLNLGAAAHTFNVNSGGLQMYLDPSAAGFAVSATLKDIKIVNNDGAVTAKIQMTLIGGTT